MTLEYLKQLAQPFKTRNEFKIAYRREYNKVIKTENWRDIVFEHMEWVAGRNKDRQKITKEEALSIALEFNTIRDLRKKDYGTYDYIKRNNLREVAFSHMKILKQPSKFKIKAKHNKGLYFLYSNNKVVYIGKSTLNITRRLIAHSEDKTFDRVEVFCMENDSDISIMEIYFISKYKPKYNVESNSNDYPTIVISNFEQMYYHKYMFNNISLEQKLMTNM